MLATGMFLCAMNGIAEAITYDINYVDPVYLGEWDDAKGTTHWYQAYSAPGAKIDYGDNGSYEYENLILWNKAEQDARSAALKYNGIKGHLATLTTKDENAAVWGMVTNTSISYWLGGYQDPGADSPSSGWNWVEDSSGLEEDWKAWVDDSQQWNVGEPNDSQYARELNPADGTVAYYKDERYLHWFNGEKGYKNKFWNDASNFSKTGGGGGIWWHHGFRRHLQLYR